MARTDRLMRLMDTLRRLPAPVTADRLATETGVSRRQLYRDIATLRAGGALIDGEAGLGYTLTEDSALPPQSFSRLEIEALVLGLSGLDQLADPALSEAGQNAIARIIATLPDRQARQAMNTVLRNFRRPDDRPPVSIDMDTLRHALWEEVSVTFRYTDLRGQASEREVWPLALSYGEGHLMLLGHCRSRMDYRLFHVAKIQDLAVTDDSFRPRRVAMVREFAETRGQYPRRNSV